MTLAKFELIDAERAHHTVSKMCAWLEVSRSGYYEWRGWPASATARRRQGLKTLIEQIFYDTYEVYGYRRVHRALLRRGQDCPPELVRVLMRELGLIPVQRRAFVPATTGQGGFRASPTWCGATSPRPARGSSWWATSLTSAPARGSVSWPRCWTATARRCSAGRWPTTTGPSWSRTLSARPSTAAWSPWGRCFIPTAARTLGSTGGRNTAGCWLGE